MQLDLEQNFQPKYYEMMRKLEVLRLVFVLRSQCDSQKKTSDEELGNVDSRLSSLTENFMAVKSPHLQFSPLYKIKKDYTMPFQVISSLYFFFIVFIM